WLVPRLPPLWGKTWASVGPCALSELQERRSSWYGTPFGCAARRLRSARRTVRSCSILRRLRHPLLDHLVGERAIELRQMVELGLVGRKALALRPQFGLQAGQLGFGDQRVDPVPTRPSVARAEPKHLAAAAGNGRSDPAGCARRTDDGELVHRLQKVRVGGGERFLHRNPSGEAKGELGAVDAVIAAVDQGDGA